MAELKTKRNKGDVHAFLNSVPDEKKRQDSFAILELMKQVTGAEPEMWGDSIVGFGKYHYKYESGREGDWFLTGFSPRKQNLTLYIMSGFDDYDQLREKLGKHKTGKSCLTLACFRFCSLPSQSTFQRQRAKKAFGRRKEWKVSRSHVARAFTDRTAPSPDPTRTGALEMLGNDLSYRGHEERKK